MLTQNHKAQHAQASGPCLGRCVDCAQKIHRTSKFIANVKLLKKETSDPEHPGPLCCDKGMERVCSGTAARSAVELRLLSIHLAMRVR